MAPIHRLRVIISLITIMGTCCHHALAAGPNESDPPQNATLVANSLNSYLISHTTPEENVTLVTLGSISSSTSKSSSTLSPPQNQDGSNGLSERDRYKVAFLAANQSVEGYKRDSVDTAAIDEVIVNKQEGPGMSEPISTNQRVLWIVFSLLTMAAIFMVVRIVLQWMRADFGTELFIAILVAGAGNVIAGVILHKVQNWRVFDQMRALIVLVPSIMGLKGNLEMVMSSRLSTQANLGRLDTADTGVPIAIGNLAVNLSKAGVIACMAGIISYVATAFGSQVRGGFSMKDLLIVASSSMTTATMCSLMLGTIMVAIIVAAHRMNIDPDNIATPISASLGDACTVGILALISTGIFTNAENAGFPVAGMIMFSIVTAACPVWFLIGYKNRYTRNLVFSWSGWWPIISALAFSVGSGMLLDLANEEFASVTLFQPVINGVGGNLAVVLASRISTSLHQQGKPGEKMVGFETWRGPRGVFLGISDHAVAARILLMLTIPVHLIYLIAIKAINGGGGYQMTVLFVVCYLFFCIFQVLFLLFLSNNVVHIFWRFGSDPDNCSSPILTSIGDFTGGICLLACFYLLKLFGDPNATPVTA